MNRILKYAGHAALLLALTAITATAGFAQTSGTVTMTATVSKFVELDSGGGITLAGNEGGGVTVDGTVNNPLAASINLGEIGVTNNNSFVTATVPLKIRSNAPYALSMSATVTSTATSTNKVTAADIGFGLGAVSRSGGGVNLTGTDTNATSGDPTLAANGSVNATSGRYEYTGAKSNLGAFTTSSSILTGSYVMNAVPRSNNNGLTVPAIFAVKPQFFENGTTSAAVTFTIVAP
ncbi:MAG TPA: hypothetical protein VK308_08465 [Pyrinomonadaceae bacterium]|nr:hypothetical protein [Pyrinomonadaceae bacterium]